MLFTIIIFLLLLSVLVFVHELGHFFVARKMGMKVEEFGFGFPPRLGAIKKGGVEYSINWIPIGGFVRIKGESGDHADEDDSFASKPAWRRFLVLIAGVTMNFVLAAVLLSFGFIVGMPSVVSDNIPAYANVSETQVRVLSIVDESPAALAGIKEGDTLISIDEQNFASSEEARAYIAEHGDEGVMASFQNAQEEVYETSLTSTELTMDGESLHGVGVGLLETAEVSYPVHYAIYHGSVATVAMTWEVLKTFGLIIRDAVVSQEMAVDVSGPVGIAKMTGEVAQLGFLYLVHFAAILSINLGVINLLPFPALDGGRILFLAIEKIRRKPVNAQVEAVVHNMGFLILIALIILVTYKDLLTIGS